MAESTPTPVSSIKSRIAALNLEEIHQPAPGAPPPYSFEQAASKKSRPPPPPPPTQRSKTINNPPLQSNAPSSIRTIGNQPIVSSDNASRQPALPPRLPPRKNTQPPPSLPPRKPSEQSLRKRESVESISTIASGRSSYSIASTKTNLSRTSTLGEGQQYEIKAPVYDPSKLPALPPKRVKEEPKPARAALKPTQSSPTVVTACGQKALKSPPTLPSRPALPSRQPSAGQCSTPQPLPPRKSALSFGMNKPTETPPPQSTVNRAGQHEYQLSGVPPPIPLASRPNLAALQASKPKFSALGECLKCRDFSGPDSHAARFPRQSIPSQDLGWIAHQLTSPFPSLTDKARAVFTWLHHNIDYDTEAFYNDRVQGSTPASTIRTGLAVCEGYAGLFTALASKAGMESIVVGGHGKGYGHTPLTPGSPIPPYAAGHAWNAVRIDDGEWKLIDCCWGAGHVQGKNMPYVRHFTPAMFTMDNNEFGKKHFPEDESRFYRTDGRAQISWEEYMTDDVGERVTVYTPTTPEHGIGESTFQPMMKHIKVYDPQHGPMVRFQFAYLCPHWDNVKHGKGKPYPMVLKVEGRDGRAPDYLPFQTDGRVWWLDASRVELGTPGQKISVYAVTSIGGQDGRGTSMAEYKQKKGKVGMGFGGIALWELV